MDVTVIVATFGGRAWQEMAESRAVPSALDEASVVRVHGESLHGARNEALRQVRSEWVVFLDADDELEPGYVAALAAGSADLRAPAVRYVTESRAHDPKVPRVFGHHHDCTADCLPEGNWLVIGTAARTEMLRAVGGFREWPVYEDWDLFLRCWLAGATVEALPAAVYRAHVRPDSRNRRPAREVKERTHREIAAANLPAVAA